MIKIIISINCCCEFCSFSLNIHVKMIPAFEGLLNCLINGYIRSHLYTCTIQQDNFSKKTSREMSRTKC